MINNSDVSKLSFYKKMPVEILYEICSAASSKDLFMSYRLIDKNFHKAAIIILCSRQDKESIYYQNQLFKTPLKSFLLEDNDFIKTLQISIKRSMQSPLSDSSHKLDALLYMADTKGVTVEISDALADVLKIKLLELKNNMSCLVSKMTPAQIDNMVKAVIEKVNNPDLINYNLVLNAFKSLTTHVNKTQIETLITDAITHVKTTSPDRRRNLLALLEVIVAHANKTQTNAIINAVTVQLDRNNPNDVDEASKTLMFLASYADETHLNALIGTVKEKINGKYGVNQAALNFVAESPAYAARTQVHGLIMELTLELSDADDHGHVIGTRLELLSKLASSADTILLNSIILSVIEKLSFEYRYIPIRALKTLAIIASHADQVQINTIITEVKNKLDDSDQQVRYAALTVLATLIPLADQTQVESLTLVTLGKIEDEIFWLNPSTNWGNFNPDDLLETFTAILPFLNESQITTLFLKISNNLQEKPFQPGEKDYAINLTFKVLERLAPRTNTSQLDTFISLVTPKLNTDDHLILMPALKSLAIIAPHVNKTQIDTLINLVIVKLDNFFPKYICEEALNTLAKLAPHADSAQIELLMPKLSEKLKDNFKFIPIAALKTLKKFPAPANETQLDNFIAVVKEKLSDREEDVRKIALETLADIVPYANKIQLEALVTAVTVKLDDSDKEVRSIALNMLSAITINSPSTHETLVEYTKSHPAVTIEHHLLEIILDTYHVIYTPKPTPTFNMEK